MDDTIRAKKINKSDSYAINYKKNLNREVKEKLITEFDKNKGDCFVFLFLH